MHKLRRRQREKEAKRKHLSPIAFLLILPSESLYDSSFMCSNALYSSTQAIQLTRYFYFFFPSLRHDGPQTGGEDGGQKKSKGERGDLLNDLITLDL